MAHGGASGAVTRKRLGPGGSAQRRLERLRKRLRDLAKVCSAKMGAEDSCCLPHFTERGGTVLE